MKLVRAGGRFAAAVTGLVALVMASAPAYAHGGGGRDGGSHDGSSCTRQESRRALALEQRRVLDRFSEFRILRDQADLDRLAVPDPETGAWYFALPHMFASMRGNGFTIVNIGGGGPDPIAGLPSFLNYRPSRHAADVTDPFGPDFPYTLVGWGYVGPYVPGAPPAFPGDPGLRCLRASSWFVHERSVHPADTWQNIPLPPVEDFKGQVAGEVPPTAQECQCEVGAAHGRFWDVHLWLHGQVPAVSMFNPGETIPGWDPVLGLGFFFPEDGPSGGADTPHCRGARLSAGPGRAHHGHAPDRDRTNHASAGQVDGKGRPRS